MRRLIYFYSDYIILRFVTRENFYDCKLTMTCKLGQYHLDRPITFHIHSECKKKKGKKELEFLDHIEVLGTLLT